MDDNQNPNLRRPSFFRLIIPLIIFFIAKEIVPAIVLYTVSLSDISNIETFDIESVLSIIEQNAIKYSSILTVITCAVSIPCGLYLMNKDKRLRYKDGTYVTYDRIRPLLFVIPLLLGIFAAVTGNNLIFISGLYERFGGIYEQVSESIYGKGIIIEIILSGILSPIVEEVIFRGLLYRRIRENMGIKYSIIISSIVFGSCHLNIVQFVYAGFLGALMAYSYEKYKSLLAPILFHIGANVFSIVATETNALMIFENNEPLYVAYIAGSAILTLLFMWLINEKVSPKVLIPAGGAPEESPYN